MPNEYSPMKDPIPVPFENLFLDPNNPRLGEAEPGYDDPKTIFAAETQRRLEERVSEMYQGVNVLEESILMQGWVGVDAIIVWQLPGNGGKYVVLEGNTRITVLRRIRAQLKVLETQYQSKLKKKDVNKESLAELKEKYEQHARAVEQTASLWVRPIEARSCEELRTVLPKVLGVRHISHAQQWKPYATNLYLVRLYREEFQKEYGDRELAIDKRILQRIAAIVSYGEIKTRRSIQAAVAFDHFKEKFEDRLPPGEQFRDEDQYFFDQILQSSFTKDQFGIDNDGLKLSEQGAAALFQWAFSKPRSKKNGENPNIFYKAENVGLWKQIKTYDDKANTSFAGNFDVDSPETAESMEKIEADYLQSKVRKSPLDTVQQLLEAFRQMPADTLISQSEHLGPILKEIEKISTTYLKMLDAAN